MGTNFIDGKYLGIKHALYWGVKIIIKRIGLTVLLSKEALLDATHLSNGSSWAIRCSFWMISAASLICEREDKGVRWGRRERTKEGGMQRGREGGGTRWWVDIWRERKREREKEQAGHRQCLHLGDHDFRAGLLHLPMLNRQLITTRLLSPGHWRPRQRQPWFSSTSNSYWHAFSEWAVIPQEPKSPSIICPARDICL